MDAGELTSRAPCSQAAFGNSRVITELFPQSRLGNVYHKEENPGKETNSSDSTTQKAAARKLSQEDPEFWSLHLDNLGQLELGMWLCLSGPRIGGFWAEEAGCSWRCWPQSRDQPRLWKGKQLYTGAGGPKHTDISSNLDSWGWEGTEAIEQMRKVGWRETMG